MNLSIQSAQAWKTIVEYRYIFTYGYKKQLYDINLSFSMNDFPHLAGFQYMKDISLPRYSNVNVADKIIEGIIPFEKVQKASKYETMIKPRLEALIHLKESLDSEFKLYSYKRDLYPFSTSIKADYLISSNSNSGSFVFILKTDPNDGMPNYLCNSLFEKSERDYEANQRVRTLMKKERIHIPSNTAEVLLDRLSSQTKTPR